MTATITWTVNPTERRTSDNFIHTAHWRCTGVDGDFSDSVYATCSWDGEPVAAYADLTEAAVLAWIWETVDKDATEAAVQAKINAQKNPVSATGVPW